MLDITVSADDLESSLQKKERVLILDLRPKEKFMEGHIPPNPMMIPDLEMGPNRCSIQ
jgi:rhodanese-related sulfurtransferase